MTSEPKMKTHGSPFHGRPHKKTTVVTTESTLTATQTTVMDMKCKHEMVNWSKWFDQNPQTSHQINCCKHECTTATTNSTNHRSHEWKSHKNKIHKFQVSGFTNKLFHVSKNNKTPTLCKFPKIHANFPVQNSAICFQSRIVTNHLIRSNWIKNTSTGAIPQDIALKSIWTAPPTH